MNISIAFSLRPRHCEVCVWQTQAGTLVAQAIDHLKEVNPTFAAQANAQWQLAVWGKPVSPQDVLHDGDRLELLRPLRVDPKVARRERFQKQGAKTAGLFAKRRAGAKAGY